MTLNLATYFVDARLAEGLGDSVAIRTLDRTCSYRQVSAMTGQVARLLDQADVRPEERVIIALPDGVPFVAALFGILRRGAAVVMVNPDSPTDLLTYFFEYTRARAAFVDHAHKAAVEAATMALDPKPRLFVVDDPGLEPQLFDATGPATPAFKSHRDDAAIWLFSGGTTGRPKAVVQTNRSDVNTTERYGQRILGLTAGDVTMSVPKLFFGYAMGSNVLFPFSVGASCVLFPERCTTETVFAQIERHQPTILINVPTMVQQMVAHPSAAGRDLRCLRLATSAGEALPAEFTSAGRPRLEWSCSMASAPQRCGTSSSPIGQGPWCPALSAASLKGSRSSCAMTKDVKFLTVSPACCGSGGIHAPSDTGNGMTTQRRRFAANGTSWATCCEGTRMTHSPTAAAWTTCSRSAGSGCPPANWRIASFNMKGCGKSRSLE